MKTHFYLAVAVFMFLVSNETLARKFAVEVTSNNLATSGFAVTAANREDGRIIVTVTRDLTKAKSFPPTSDLRVVRSAVLEVWGPSNLVIRCELQPKRANEKIEYSFDISPEYVAHSRLYLNETDDYKEQLNRRELIGGGTYFTLQLSNLVKPE